MAKSSTKRASARKTQAVQRGDTTAEAQSTTSGKRKAAERQFSEADMAAAVGLPPGLDEEQRENLTRKAVLGG